MILKFLQHIPLYFRQFPRFSKILLVFFFLFLGGVLSLLMGQDASIDLLNYHLYNPFAFLTHRSAADLIPAGMHSFFNPLLDVPFYFIFSLFNDFPRLAAFLQGWGYGLFLFFVWEIGALLWAECSAPRDILIRLSAFVMAATGGPALSQIGLSSNEVLLAAGGACVLWLLLKQQRAPSRRNWLMAAFLTGALFGLKYTFGPAALGLASAGLYLWCRQGKDRKTLGLCILGGVGGFLLTNGLFMWELWQQTGNPFFPYFNAVFQSPFFDSINLPNGIGTPQTWQEWLFLPFMRLHSGMLELQTDWRLALGLAAGLGWSIFLLLPRRSRPGTIPEGIKPLLLFFGVTYIFWLSVFSVMRYEILLDLAGALLLAAGLQQLLGKTTGAAAAAVLTLVLLYSPPADWGRTAYRQKNFIASLPRLEENALVLLAGHISFLALANPQASYVGGIWFDPEDYVKEQKYLARQLNILQPADYRFHFEEQIRQKIRAHAGPLYIMGPRSSLVKDPATWRRYGVEITAGPSSCIPFTSNLDIFYGGFWLCPARKTTVK